MRERWGRTRGWKRTMGSRSGSPKLRLNFKFRVSGLGEYILNFRCVRGKGMKLIEFNMSII